MQSWIAKVWCPGLAPFWFGTVVAAHLPLNTQLLGIATEHIGPDDPEEYLPLFVALGHHINLA